LRKIIRYTGMKVLADASYEWIKDIKIAPEVKKVVSKSKKHKLNHDE
jgi:hypothetical protein